MAIHGIPPTGDAASRSPTSVAGGVITGPGGQLALAPSGDMGLVSWK
jgi:hypothetical protein